MVQHSDEKRVPHLPNSGLRRLESRCKQWSGTGCDWNYRKKWGICSYRRCRWSRCCCGIKFSHVGRKNAVTMTSMYPSPLLTGHRDTAILSLRLCGMHNENNILNFQRRLTSGYSNLYIKTQAKKTTLRWTHTHGASTHLHFFDVSSAPPDHPANHLRRDVHDAADEAGESLEHRGYRRSMQCAGTMRHRC